MPSQQQDFLRGKGHQWEAQRGSSRASGWDSAARCLRNNDRERAGFRMRVVCKKRFQACTAIFSLAASFVKPSFYRKSCAA